MDEARRRLIAVRTREAIAERKRAGTYRGPQPFGDRSTIEAIIGLRRRGWSLRKIAWLLTVQGLPTARGGPWRHSTVRKVLLREAPDDVRSSDGAVSEDVGV